MWIAAACVFLEQRDSARRTLEILGEPHVSPRTPMAFKLLFDDRPQTLQKQRRDRMRVATQSDRVVIELRLEVCTRERVSLRLSFEREHRPLDLSVVASALQVMACRQGNRRTAFWAGSVNSVLRSNLVIGETVCVDVSGAPWYTVTLSLEQYTAVSSGRTHLLRPVGQFVTESERCRLDAPPGSILALTPGFGLVEPRRVLRNTRYPSFMACAQARGSWVAPQMSGLSDRAVRRLLFDLHQPAETDFGEWCSRDERGGCPVVCYELEELATGVVPPWEPVITGPGVEPAWMLLPAGEPVEVETAPSCL